MCPYHVTGCTLMCHRMGLSQHDSSARLYLVVLILPRTMQAKDSNPGRAREFHLSHCGYGIIHIQQLNTTCQCNKTQGDTSPHLKEGAFIPATLQNFSTFPEGTRRRRPGATGPLRALPGTNPETYRSTSKGVGLGPSPFKTEGPEDILC